MRLPCASKARNSAIINPWAWLWLVLCAYSTNPGDFFACGRPVTWVSGARRVERIGRRADSFYLKHCATRFPMSHPSPRHVARRVDPASIKVRPRRHQWLPVLKLAASVIVAFIPLLTSLVHLCELLLRMH